MKPTKRKAKEDEPEDPRNFNPGNEEDAAETSAAPQPVHRPDPNPTTTNFLEWCCYCDIASLKPIKDRRCHAVPLRAAGHFCRRLGRNFQEKYVRDRYLASQQKRTSPRTWCIWPLP